MELLKEFSITQIVMFLILAAAAIKGIINFFDWASARMKDKVHSDEKPIDLEHKLDRIEETHNKHIESLRQKDQELQAQLMTLMNKVDLLIESDKDDIKSWITAQHHYFVEKQYIDTYSLDGIERRYNHYVKENGNSFVEDLVKEIRKLPKK